MLWPTLVLIAAADPVVATTPPAPPHTYLKGAEERRCADAPPGDEIVVCGHDAQGDRLRPLGAGDRYEARPLRAARAIGGGGTLAVHNEAASVGGVPSSRAMVTLTVPLPGTR